MKDKIILIVSPQAWGKMFISKHHYAIALAKRGNTVYFLNPPNDPKPAGGGIVIKKSGVHENLLLVEHQLFFPYDLKFHLRPVFQFLMRWQVRRVLSKINKELHIIWCFDIGNFYPFRFFPAKPLKIFHPVDEPLHPEAIDAASGADIIFSVTQEILDKYAHLGIPCFFVNHGVTEEFLNTRPQVTASKGSALHAGFSGSLLREDIDRAVLLEIVRENPHIHFNCWGSYQQNNSTVAGKGSEEQRKFIHQLQLLPNVILYGPVSVDVLAVSLHKMDMFLICYDVKRDQSRGTNYHKVLEYISTGKVIVSNNITTYQNLPGLVEMVTSRDNNNELPALFRKVAAALPQFNTNELRQQRIDFANNNTYEKQVERIEKILPRVAKIIGFCPAPAVDRTSNEPLPAEL